jgi:hypothetical protein
MIDEYGNPYYPSSTKPKEDTTPMPKLRKTDTRSLARVLADECLTDPGQVKSIKNAAYKAGFAMAASIINNYVRNAERNNHLISAGQLKFWCRNSQKWRNAPSMSDPPEVV